MSIINLTFIYWVGISGLNQSKVELHHSKFESEINLSESHNMLKEITVEESIYQQLLLLINEKKIFKNPELTLSVLANELKNFY